MVAVPFPDEERTCRECQRSLPLASSFGRNPVATDGYESICLDCIRERREQAKQTRRLTPPNHATLRTMQDGWNAQRAMDREIHERAERIQAILAAARPLHPLSREERLTLRRLQAEQDAAWEAQRRLRAEWKLAVIAEQRPEQLAQYETPVKWQRRRV